MVQKITEKDELEVVNAYQSNFNIREILKKFKINNIKLYSILKKYNISKRKPDRKKPISKTRIGENIRCFKCKEFKNKDFFQKCKDGYKTICKKCHSESEINRLSKISREKKRETSVKEYNKIKEKRKKAALNELPIEESIKIWIDNVIKRKCSGGKFSSRKNLCRKNLMEKCLKAKELYPYIVFCYVEGLGLKRSMIASLDKIDSLKEYSDDNIQVIPLWLNSAKLDLNQDELDDLIISYIKINLKLSEKIKNKNF